MVYEPREKQGHVVRQAFLGVAPVVVKPPARAVRRRLDENAPVRWHRLREAVHERVRLWPERHLGAVQVVDGVPAPERPGPGRADVERRVQFRKGELVLCLDVELRPLLHVVNEKLYLPEQLARRVLLVGNCGRVGVVGEQRVGRYEAEDERRDSWLPKFQYQQLLVLEDVAVEQFLRPVENQ